MRRIFIFTVSALGLMSQPAWADESAVTLKEAPGKEMVETRCVACHSLDYIKMNSRFLNAAGWDAEIQKMIRKFGAPIDADEAKAVLDYLIKNYGT